MPGRPSRWKAQHVGCQKAVDNVKADLTKEIEELRRQLAIAEGVEDNLVTENELLWAAFNAAEILFKSLAPKDAPIKVPTQTLIDINNLGHAIVAVRESIRADSERDGA